MWVPEEWLDLMNTVVDRLCREYSLDDKRELLSTAEAATAGELGMENIVGFGFGEKIVGGLPTDFPAIQVLVVRKAPEHEVHPEYLATNILHRIEKYEPPFQLESDVIEVGRPTVMHHVSKTLVPRIPSGACVGPSQGNSSGTVAAWLTDDTAAMYLLTCWHVADGLGGPGQTQLLHPAGGKPVATLVASISPFSGSQTTVDAAIGAAIDPNEAGDFVMGIGEIRGTLRVRSTYFPVRKYGAVTHLTTGGITSLTASLTLSIPGQGATLYRNQLGILPDPSVGPFAAGGDSGSLIMSKDNCVIGVFVGGDAQIPYYVATPIRAVLDELKTAGHSLRFVTYP